MRTPRLCLYVGAPRRPACQLAIGAFGRPRVRPAGFRPVPGRLQARRGRSGLAPRHREDGFFLLSLNP